MHSTPFSRASDVSISIAQSPTVIHRKKTFLSAKKTATNANVPRVLVLERRGTEGKGTFSEPKLLPVQCKEPF